jgi:hypothetical protein
MKQYIFILFLFLYLPLSLEARNTAFNNDFEVKAFHVDLRCQVMTMEALKELANKLSSIGVNTLIIEWEGTFPFDKHATLSNKYAYSTDDILSFINYCCELGIDVIPLQNCFGHVEYILRHDRYAVIREDKKEVSQVCPMREEENKKIFTEIFTEVASLHPSKYFHIGGDETYLLGSCERCSTKADSGGKSKLFVDYINLMCDIVRSLDKTPIMWADIILEYPESADELSKDIIFIDWNYGWRSDRFGDTENLLKHGFQLWGAPAIRSYPDNLYLTQWNKHFDNISTFIPDCRKAGYKGIVMTSWSTSGQYGFSYNAEWEVISMYPIRYVYPMSGFNLLITAYGDALRTHNPLDPHQYIIDYGKQHFNMTGEESEILYKILFTPQNLVLSGKDTEGKSVLRLTKEAIDIQKELNSLRPKTNKKEFEHLCLMFDIRLQYLTFKEIESRYQSKDFDKSKVDIILADLCKLSLQIEENDRRFIDLNYNYLHLDELIEINRVRNEKYNILYQTIKNLAK